MNIFSYCVTEGLADGVKTAAPLSTAQQADLEAFINAQGGIQSRLEREVANIQNVLKNNGALGAAERARQEALLASHQQHIHDLAAQRQSLYNDVQMAPSERGSASFGRAMPKFVAHDAKPVGYFEGLYHGPEGAGGRLAGTRLSALPGADKTRAALHGFKPGAPQGAAKGMLGGMGRWGKIGLGVGAAGLGLYGLNKLLSPSKPPEMERPIYG